MTMNKWNNTEIRIMREYQYQLIINNVNITKLIHVDYIHQ